MVATGALLPTDKVVVSLRSHSVNFFLDRSIMQQRGKRGALVFPLTREFPAYRTEHGLSSSITSERIGIGRPFAGKMTKKEEERKDAVPRHNGVTVRVGKSTLRVFDFIDCDYRVARTLEMYGSA